MDANWYRDVNNLAVHTTWAHGIGLFYANYAPGLFALLILIAYLYARPHGPKAVAVTVWATIGTVLAVGVNQPVVNLVHRVRPYNAMTGVEVLVTRSHDFSFPSDHTVVAGAAAAAIWLVNRRLAIVATLAAVLLAFARVYVGAHYPSDVAAGLTLGAAITLGGWALLHRPATAFIARLAHTPLRPLITTKPHNEGSSRPTTVGRKQSLPDGDRGDPRLTTKDGIGSQVRARR